MKTKDYILKALKEADDYLSGEELAGELNISRAAVWQAIKTLRKEGHHIDAITNRGYRLNEGYEELDENTIKNRLDDELNHVTVLIKDSVDSTNDAIFREDAASALPSFSFMAASIPLRISFPPSSTWISEAVSFMISHLRIHKICVPADK